MPNGGGWEVSAVHFQRQEPGGAWSSIGGTVPRGGDVLFRGGFSVANGTPGSPIETGTGSFQTFQGGAWVELTFVHVVIPGYSTIEGGEPVTYPPIYVTDQYTMAEPESRRFRFVLSWVDGDWTSAEIVMSSLSPRDIDATLPVRTLTAGVALRGVDTGLPVRALTAGLPSRSLEATLPTRTLTAGVVEQ